MKQCLASRRPDNQVFNKHHHLGQHLTKAPSPTKGRQMLNPGNAQ